MDDKLDLVRPTLGEPCVAEVVNVERHSRRRRVRRALGRDTSRCCDELDVGRQATGRSQVNDPLGERSSDFVHGGRVSGNVLLSEQRRRALDAAHLADVLALGLAHAPRMQDLARLSRLHAGVSVRRPYGHLVPVALGDSVLDCWLVDALALKRRLHPCLCVGVVVHEVVRRVKHLDGDGAHVGRADSVTVRRHGNFWRTSTSQAMSMG